MNEHIQADVPKSEKPKRAAGRGARIRPRERSVIQSLALTGMSAREIARQLDRSPHAVCRVLNGQEMTQLRELARSALMGNAIGFADDLIKASRVGAAKGKYEAALQALLGLKAIDNPKAATDPKGGLTVKIGMLLPGLGQTATTSLDVPALPVVTTEEQK
jgi:Helix-turn-helix domain